MHEGAWMENGNGKLEIKNGRWKIHNKFMVQIGVEVSVSKARSLGLSRKVINTG